MKICGITRPADAELAAALGASAVGMVLWAGSPRAVGLDAAREIAAAVPRGVTIVGVLVDPTAAEVAAVVEGVPVDALQVYGGGLPAGLRGGSVRVIRAVPVGDGGDTGAVEVNAIPPDVLVLLDARDDRRIGGTGRRIDWHAAARLARQRPIVLAGGLQPSNVAAAIGIVEPYAVDVSSGVESAPGVKDRGRLEQFFERVTAAAGPVPRGLFA
ncbi:MAG TPA: phosphoribosylanthranilate isomerase [Vicinamibacterales bacterium]|nr:phosphoribosylanthranilate isomerase [Vicinamibacterales bacterium]